ncbi:Uncharacterized protein HZ326_29744 [Fusarium oxysporum f. sp. albedinis]|nr:Uncharacterized protein HZ326_29744 [Fusarium oxysporum f. sp. albedinis]
MDRKPGHGEGPAIRFGLKAVVRCAVLRRILWYGLQCCILFLPPQTRGLDLSRLTIHLIETSLALFTMCSF